MDNKGWLFLILQIICNGFVVFLIQIMMQYKVERMRKKRELRDRTYLEFIEKINDFENCIVDIYIDVENASRKFDYDLNKLFSLGTEVISYYDINKFEFEESDKKYKDWETTWVDFKKSLNEYIAKTNTKSKLNIGEKLNILKEKSMNLKRAIRSKY